MQVASVRTQAAENAATAAAEVGRSECAAARNAEAAAKAEELVEQLQRELLQTRAAVAQLRQPGQLSKDINNSKGTRLQAVTTAKQLQHAGVRSQQATRHRLIADINILAAICLDFEIPLSSVIDGDRQNGSK
jgi:hypothetical protein